jgi:hypothetical protein
LRRRERNSTTDGIAIIPDDMDFASAGSIPMSAMTAWQMLFEHAGIDRARLTGGASLTLPKTRVLITAASAKLQNPQNEPGLYLHESMRLLCHAQGTHRVSL